MCDTLSVYKIERNGNVRFFGKVYPALAEDMDSADVSIIHWEGGRP